MKTIKNTIKKAKHALGASLIATLGFNASYAQSEVQIDEDLFDMSLEELMEVSIESASKKKESLFDAPLASSTITAAEIEKAGISNIVEALRLAPGVIVRQQENGVYDVQIRGLDNLTGDRVGFSATNTATLVMINDRPVFNHNLGGTFWESFPIDVSDIERIEIVRGPAAPLFGPNAVTGVINFITRTPEDGRVVSARAEGGSSETMAASMYYGDQINDDLSVFVSGNYQKRGVFDNQVYNYFTESYMERSSLSEIGMDNLLLGDHALQRAGVNAGVYFNPSEEVTLDLTLGYQDDEVYKNFAQNSGLGMGYTTTQSAYANLAGSIKGWNFRTSYSKGKENLSYNLPPNQYDFSVLDATVEYEWKPFSGLTVVPGVSYINAAFDEADYNNQLTYLAGDEQSIVTKSGYLRTDWNVFDKLRIIAAVRADHFSSKDGLNVSYEGAATFKIDDNNIVRASITRSNTGSFVGYSYLDTNLGLPSLGDQNLDLFTVQAIELGYRTKIGENLHAEINAFQQQAKNVTFLGLNFNELGLPFFEFQNAEMEARQHGVTIALNYVPTSALQFKPFVMIQQTKVQNGRTTYDSPAYELYDHDHEYTPTVVGGWFLNYTPGSKWNFNLNGYYFSNQTFGDADELLESTTYDSKLILNVVAQYQVMNSLNVFLSAKNLLGDDEREFVVSSRIDRYFGAGLSLNIK